MRRRLQFSLLGLMLLTAAIAIGVKWWIGPHHVVERPSPNIEDEFTYTRDWDGTKIVDGPRVLRYSHPDGSPRETHVFFYRRGEKTEHDAELVALGDRELMHSSLMSIGLLPLEPTERARFDATIETEKRRIVEAGFRVHHTEMMPIPGPESEPTDEIVDVPTNPQEQGSAPFE